VKNLDRRELVADWRLPLFHLRSIDLNRLEKVTLETSGFSSTAAKEAGALAKPPGGSKARPRKKGRVKNNPTLADAGIDKNLAHSARKQQQQIGLQVVDHGVQLAVFGQLNTCVGSAPAAQALIA
jgi:hypothetical protein